MAEDYKSHPESMRYPPVDLHGVLSRDVPINIIMSARSRGKTYNVLLWALRQWERSGDVMVNLYRTKEDLKELKPSFFVEKSGKIPEFRKYVWKIDKNFGYLAPIPDEGEKPQWKVFCWFIVLGNEQGTKQHVFHDGVSCILFDEALISQSDLKRGKKYLPNEWALLSNLYLTIGREYPGKVSKLRVFLLCNSCGLFNPYFQIMEINDVPSYGYHVYSDAKGALLLFYNEQPPEGWEEAMATDTVAGRMLSFGGSGDGMLSNSFDDANREFVERRPKGSVFEFGLKWSGELYGVWANWETGYYYISRDVRKSGEIYAITREDSGLNYILVRKNSGVFSALSDACYMGLIRYEDQAVKHGFEGLLARIGVL